jgi:peptidyl-prolyl cis-trans isomerase A (cyclophilin A)
VAALGADTTLPVVIQTVPDQTLGEAGLVSNVNLTTHFQNPEATGTAVRMTTTVGSLGTGNIDVALYDTLTPKTVANFLAYINAGYYGNDIIHRSVPGFVIQGGGYDISIINGNATVSSVPAFAPVQNEFAGSGLSNVAGTIAMAEVGSDPNSATNEWFINVADNSQNLNFQNGGFTVFGKIVGNGLAVAQIINSSQCGPYDESSFLASWQSIPLSGSGLTFGNLVYTNMATVPTLTYSAVSGNTSLVTVSMNGNIVQLTPSATHTGTANITITTTALDAGQIQTNFNVTVVAQGYNLWITPFNLSPSSANATANPSGDGVPNLLKFAFGGTPTLATRAPGLPQAESGGGVAFYQRQLSGLSYEVDESFDLVNWTKIWQTSDGLNAAVVAMHTSISGFDIVTIRDAAPATIRFWRVRVTQTL